MAAAGSAEASSEAARCVRDPIQQGAVSTLAQRTGSVSPVGKMPKSGNQRVEARVASFASILNDPLGEFVFLSLTTLGLVG